MARLNIEIDAEMRKELRIAALEAAVPMRQIVETLIGRFLVDTQFREETISRIVSSQPSESAD